MESRKERGLRSEGACSMGTEQQITERIKELAAATEETIIADRRYFHAHPELSSKEVSTAGTICARLARMGIPYERVAKTGIIATIAARPTTLTTRRAIRKSASLFVLTLTHCLFLNARVFLMNRRILASCMHAVTIAISPCCLVRRVSSCRCVTKFMAKCA